MQPQTLSQPNLLSHLRALYALIRKEWKQYWRYPLKRGLVCLSTVDLDRAGLFHGAGLQCQRKSAGFLAIQRDHRLHVLYSSRNCAGELHQRGVLGNGIRPQKRHGLGRHVIKLADTDSALVNSRWALSDESNCHSNYFSGNVIDRWIDLRLQYFGQCMEGLPANHSNDAWIIRLWLCVRGSCDVDA